MTKRDPLTPRQMEVWTFFLDHKQAHGVNPTYQEASTHFGVSKVTIFEVCEALVKKGWMRRTSVRAARYTEAVPMVAPITIDVVEGALRKRLIDTGTISGILTDILAATAAN